MGKDIYKDLDEAKEKNKFNKEVKENIKYNRLSENCDFELGAEWNQNANFFRRNSSDDNIDILENAVSQLKSVGYEIRSEINTHLGILDEISSTMDSTNRRIKIAQKILNRLVNMASTTTLTIIAFLLFILLVLQWTL